MSKIGDELVQAMEEALAYTRETGCMVPETGIPVIESRGNVFADIGLPEPEEQLAGERALPLPLPLKLGGL